MSEFVVAAKEMYPGIDSKINRQQILSVMRKHNLKWPNFERVSRGVYEFPMLNINTESESDMEIRIKETFESLETLVASVASNTVNSLVVAGAPGLGKSYKIGRAHV